MNEEDEIWWWFDSLEPQEQINIIRKEYQKVRREEANGTIVSIH